MTNNEIDKINLEDTKPCFQIMSLQFCRSYPEGNIREAAGNKALELRRVVRLQVWVRKSFPHS